MLFCVKKEGVGTPLLFIHGFLGDHEDFAPIYKNLKNPILAIDLPGHGQSPPQQKITFESLTQQIGELITQPVHVIGYSMGGRIALFLKSLFPDKVQKMILIGSYIQKQQSTNSQRFIQEWSHKLHTYTTKEFIHEWYQQDLFQSLSIPSNRWKNCLKSVAPLFENLSSTKQPDFTSLVENEAQNCLLICGKNDTKYCTHYAQFSKNLLKTIEDVGHSVHIESIDKTLEAIMTHTATTTYEDIIYTKDHGIAKISINRPEKHNAFRPQTVKEMIHSLQDAWHDEEVGVVILTGEGGRAFCSGGDQKIRKEEGYSDENGVQSLNVLEFQKLLRTIPKPTIAAVAGYAIGGGHVLHVMCDLTIAADNAIFGQTGPKVGSFDGGFGASYLASIVGQKKAREIWYLCRQYNAQEALDMGLVNCVVPLEDLQHEAEKWASEMLLHSPMALRCLKSSFNAALDGQSGIQELAGNATMLFYMSEEAQEGHRSFLEKRQPNFTKFKKRG